MFKLTVFFCYLRVQLILWGFESYLRMNCFVSTCEFCCLLETSVHVFFDLGYIWKWIRCKNEGYLRIILCHEEYFTWGILESDTLIWGLRHLRDTWEFIVLWGVLESYLTYLRSCVGSLKVPDDFGDALYFTIHGYDYALVFSRLRGAECFQQHHYWT